MEKNEIKGVLVDTRKGTVERYKFIHENSYHDIVDICKCEYIECVARNIAGHIVDVYCDEEGLLKHPRERVAILTRRNDTHNIVEHIHGNCLIITHDSKGNSKSLTNKVIKDILNNGTIKMHDPVTDSDYWGLLAEI